MSILISCRCYLAGLAAAALAAGCAAPTPATTAAERWASELAAFDASDARQPPAPGQIVFVGSSSIRLWDLQRFLPGLDVLNRGFGGSEMSDCAELAARLVVPHSPRAVVVYAGDNDIGARGKSAEAVLADARLLASRIHAALPRSRIHFISIKPSPSRWGSYPEMRRANELLAAWCRLDARLGFIDVASAMLRPDGQPREELYAADGLHLNDAGYALWSEKVRAALAAE